MGLRSRIKKMIACHGETQMESPEASVQLDLREEYANAFRTESYIDFWTCVVSLTDGGASAKSKPLSLTTAARLPSYRLFAEHLLNPNQPTVIKILNLAPIEPKNHALLLDYFLETSNASILCGILLKDIGHVRTRYGSLKLILKTMESPSQINHLPVILTQLNDFCHTLNPFIKSPSSPHNIQTLQTSCFTLLKRLEANRDKTRAKLRTRNKIKLGSAIILITLTASLTIIVVAHALVALMAAPSIVMTTASSKQLAKWSAQVDVAAKGTYILSRDLDTISRLVARLGDELEHMRKMVKFWLGRGEDQLQASGEVARHLKKNDLNFSSQLDELEEHLYLCFMTVNRARNLVIKEINDPNTT
ncbi:Homogentisate phytyltransferase 1 [Heracleum sosnowskyi]|uniref:Homogentisate phytyltransferase 1 n=1 Tax=Heracleum sosnowskyi TaxID=360622 RepID=A0AAD8IWZ0_9APIA|nr:Homogentisate phytyltransferase 1 [Heracleum sosnowskyi]